MHSPPAANLLIVSGLKREAILAGPACLSICGNAATLQAKLAELADATFVPSGELGLCGGLDPLLRPGDLVMGTEVVSEAGSIIVDKTIMLALQRHLATTSQSVVIGRVVGVHAPVMTARAKADLNSATGALAVDMESQIAGRFALQRGVPFAILRAVSDPAERDLPPLIANAVKPNGQAILAAVMARAYPLAGAARPT